MFVLKDLSLDQCSYSIYCIKYKSQIYPESVFITDEVFTGMCQSVHGGWGGVGGGDRVVVLSHHIPWDQTPRTIP